MFITLSIVLERMRYEGVVDMFQTVKMLRTQRPAMVQTEVKFQLLLIGQCYNFLICFYVFLITIHEIKKKDTFMVKSF